MAPVLTPLSSQWMCRNKLTFRAGEVRKFRSCRRIEVQVVRVNKDGSVLLLIDGAEELRPGSKVVPAVPINVVPCTNGER